MRLSIFQYDLPDALIAQRPATDRDASRLLCLDGVTGEVCDSQFRDIGRWLRPGDLLILNDSRVIPARLYGKKSSGGKVEVLIERILTPKSALAHIKASKSPKPDAVLNLENDVTARVCKRHDTLFELEFDACVLEYLDRFGHVPLPPYIRRSDDEQDRDRYQTVYAREPGAVAAPTAGLHFTQELLDVLRESGIGTAAVTLHVGAATFQPVRVEDIEDHSMHSEYLEVSPELCRRVEDTKCNGGRIVAVGTTSVRALETAAADGSLKPFCGDTDIFIYPGYRFRVVDALLTNFHLPESTLLMLVSAFAGHQNTLSAYQHAVHAQYRFFSYGDAMFISRPEPALDAGTVS